MGDPIVLSLTSHINKIVEIITNYSEISKQKVQGLANKVAVEMNRNEVARVLGKSTGNPQVVTVQPVLLPTVYLYPSQGYRFACGLVVKDP